MIKEKKRYVVVIAEPGRESEEVAEAVESSFLRVFGEYGVMEARLKPVKKVKDGVIFECAVSSLPRLLFSTALVKEIEGDPAALRVLRISGTLKRAKEAAPKRR